MVFFSFFFFAIALEIILTPLMFLNCLMFYLIIFLVTD
jgi:hypothetical protein